MTAMCCLPGSELICRRSGGSATGNEGATGSEGSTGNDGGTGNEDGNGTWLWAMAAATYRGVTGEWRQLRTASAAVAGSGSVCGTGDEVRAGQRLRTAAGALRFYGTILLSISLK